MLCAHVCECGIMYNVTIHVCSYTCRSQRRHAPPASFQMVSLNQELSWWPISPRDFFFPSLISSLQHRQTDTTGVTGPWELMWVVECELKTLCLYSKHFYPLSRSYSPTVLCKFLIKTSHTHLEKTCQHVWITQSKKKRNCLI